MTTFVQGLVAAKKTTKAIRFEAGEPGRQPVTKRGGLPFWPAGTARPTCRATRPCASSPAWTS